MKTLFTAHGEDLPLNLNVKYPTNTVQMNVWEVCPVVAPPTGVFRPMQIAYFSKDPALSCGEYVVYTLTNDPPTGWSWIVIKGRLRAIETSRLRKP